MNTSLSRTHNIIKLLIASSGFAALSWEVIWQIKLTIALGISAWGTALTLAIMMGGMSIGGFWMGYFLRNKPTVIPFRIYGALELMAGTAGLFLNTAIRTLEKIDTAAYAIFPNSITLIYFFGLIIIIGIPTLCMGATIPVFGLIAKQLQISIAKLYSHNTLGAGISVLIVAFIFIPVFGINTTIWIIASINIVIGILASVLAPSESISIKPSRSLTSSDSVTVVPALISGQRAKIKDQYKIMFIVFVTGFATFTLEIAWFRSLSSVFQNTTDIFAMMLACVLIALGLASKDISKLKLKKKPLGLQLWIAGILILLITPLIEHLDMGYLYQKQMLATNPNDVIQLNSTLLSDINFLAIPTYALQIALRFLCMYIIIVPPIRYLGRAFPWILDDQMTARQVGRLYAINTFAAVIGSIGAAWLLLPTIGFAKTAWLAGILVILVGIAITPGRHRYFFTLLGMSALCIAIYFESGIGKSRAQGYYASDNEGRLANVLAFYEGPQETVSAIEYPDTSRALLINSTAAAWESGTIYRPSVHYMASMGQLPMLLQSDPQNALVICFGTGQTANAVRNENPQSLDIVDVNPSVFKLAHYFRSNANVLNDTRVTSIIMDGRAYIRRSRKYYNVITLEPMPPSMAGVNALYSKEFYMHARERLAPHGVIAQWLPFHIVGPRYTASIVKTFINVFPNAILWLDQDSRTGILLGTNDEHPALGSVWPGFARKAIKRDLTEENVKQSIALDQKALKEYSRYGTIISDDNQLLAYGKALYPTGLFQENIVLLQKINNKIAIQQINSNYR